MKAFGSKIIQGIFFFQGTKEGNSTCSIFCFEIITYFLTSHIKSMNK